MAPLQKRVHEMDIRFWADCILGLHLFYVLGLLLPLILIPVGAWRKWSWIRNPWIRYLHLAMGLFLVLQTVTGWTCFLTVWEQNFRELAGEQGYSTTFVEYWLGKLLYLDLSESTFTLLYLLLGASILGLQFLYPPRTFYGNSKPRSLNKI